MTKETLLEKIHEIKQLESKKKILENEIESLKDAIKADMLARNVSEDIVDIFTVRYTDVTSNRFDSTKFKKDHPDMYESYLTKSVSSRFTINS